MAWAIVRGVIYDMYIMRVFTKMNINHENRTFAYAFPFDPLALQPFQSDEEFTNMISFNDKFAQVYISILVPEDVVTQDERCS